MVSIGAVTVYRWPTPSSTKQVSTPATKSTRPGPTAATPVPVVSAPSPAAPATSYPQHANIIATMFYIGEPGDDENGNIPNADSTWDEQWQEHYGGTDSPYKRNGWLPAGFTSKQNPFYIALPYNDLDEEGSRKASASHAYWHAASDGNGSYVKNRWVEVCFKGACAYGQWEDAGPFGEDDWRYVFGSARPANKIDLKAGIDVSPAINDYLKLNSEATVSWRFTDTPPTGPWQQITTK